MYNKLYNFTEKPFNLTPDPKFLFLTPSHKEALASMMYGIKERKGFISITGEVGTGKTTLVYTLLSNLDEKIKTVFIYHTNTTFEQLLRNMLHELDIPVGDEDKTSLLHKLNEYLIQRLSQEETLAVIIDEAQNLPKEVMEELRMLSNLETTKSKLLQIVLVGQPELDIKLNFEDLRQLKQRIGIRRQISPLSQEESKKYIEHRLKLVGSSTSKVFTSEALSLICTHAGGIPRVINILCDNAFLIGYSESRKKINAQIVEEVIRDMEQTIEEVLREMDGSAVEKPVKRHTEAVKAPSPAPKPLFNRVAVPLLSLLCVGLLALLGREYMQNTPLQADHIKPSKDLYAMKMNKDAGPKVKTAMPALNTNASLNEIPSEPLSHHTILTAPDETKTEPLSSNESNAPSSKIESAPENVLLPAPLSIGSATTLETEPEIKRIINVKKGYSISQLAQKNYQMANATLIDLILKENPAITDANLIQVNQQITIPEITEELLLSKSPDTTYNIHLGTFYSADCTTIYKDEPALKGKEINVIPHKVSPGETWYRVVLGKYATKEESLKTIKVLRKKGLLPCFSNNKMQDS